MFSHSRSFLSRIKKQKIAIPNNTAPLYLTLNGFVVEPIKRGTGNNNPIGPYIMLTIPYNRSDNFVIFLISDTFLFNSYFLECVYAISKMTN